MEVEERSEGVVVADIVKGRIVQWRDLMQVGR